MGVREEALDLLRSGLSPKEIAKRQGVTLATILGYLDQLVGRGDVRRSDILFSVQKDVRQIILSIAGNKTTSDSWDIVHVQAKLKEQEFDVDREDIDVVLKYGDARHALGDMYEDIRTIETYLHQLIRKGLEKEYGKEELGWWRRGVPETTRRNCQLRREEDPEPVADPYCYTELLDLANILNKQWNVLSKRLAKDVAQNKNTLLSKLGHLNTIRRNVMHPVRGAVPLEDDFEFVHELKQSLVK